MAGSGDELAAGAEDRGRLRASDADREQVVTVLKAAFVQGRLTRDEFYLRVTQVFASRTYADLDALTADIPAGVAKPQPPEPAGQPDSEKLISRGIAFGAGAGLLIPVVVGIVAGVNTGGPMVGVVVGVVAGVVVSVLVAGLLSVFLPFLSWVLDKSSGRRPSQRPPATALPTQRGRPAQVPITAQYQDLHLVTSVHQVTCCRYELPDHPGGCHRFNGTSRGESRVCGFRAAFCVSFVPDLRN